MSRWLLTSVELGMQMWPWNTASLVGACISIAAILLSFGSYFIGHSEYRSHEAAPASPPQVRRRLGHLILDPKTVEIRQPSCQEPPHRNAADYAHLFREKTVFMTMASSGQVGAGVDFELLSNSLTCEW